MEQGRSQIRCSKCSLPYSKILNSCPHCGNGFWSNLIHIENAEIKKDIVFFLAIFVGALIYFSSSDEKETIHKEDEKVITKEVIPKTAEQIKQEKIRSQFSAWDGSHKDLKQRVKQKMNDPSSFEHIRSWHAISPPNEIYVFMLFRGNNVFGAKVQDKASAVYTIDGDFLRYNDEL